MEQQDPLLIHSLRMKNKPPLPPEATPICRKNHKIMQTTKLGNSRTTSSPPPEFDQLESYVPLSVEPEIT